MKRQSLVSIICILFSFVCHAQTNVTNQRLFDTVGFMPEYYPQRVAIFEQEPVVPGRIIFLGNSITQLGDWKKLLNDTTTQETNINSTFYSQLVGKPVDIKIEFDGKDKYKQTIGDPKGERSVEIYERLK